jgi:hypothetical protein
MRITLNQYAGFDCNCEHGVSYNCPKLALYGYSTEPQLHSAIRRKLKKNPSLAGGEYPIGYMQNKGAI